MQVAVRLEDWMVGPQKRGIEREESLQEELWAGNIEATMLSDEGSSLVAR